jgi:hypothetical protein
MKFRSYIFIILLSFSLAACSLAEDITPPPNYVAPTIQPTIIPTLALTQTPIPPAATETPVPTSTVATNSSTVSVPNGPGTPSVEASPTAQSSGASTPAATSATTPLAEVSPTAQVSQATVSGTVTVASGATLPSGTIATLLVYDSSVGNVTLTLTTPIQPDGKYEFTNVPADTNTVFLVTVDYSGVVYDSTPLNFTLTSSQFDLPLTVYEITTDQNVLTITQAHLQFDFSTAGTVQVMVLYVISNPGTTAVTVASDGTNVPFIQIPAGAQSVNFQLAQSSSPLMSATNGFALLPGANLQYGIIATYNLPYTNKLDFSQPFSLPVSSATIIVPEGVKVTSDQLTDAGTQGSTGTTYHLYSGSSLASGSTLNLTVSGMPGDKTSSGFVLNQHTWLLIGVGALGVVLIGLGIFLFLRDRRLKKLEDELGDEDEGDKDDSLGEDREGIMDAIITLDDQFKTGDISQEAYEKRRNELKDRLKNLI